MFVLSYSRLPIPMNLSLHQRPHHITTPKTAQYRLETILIFPRAHLASLSVLTSPKSRSSHHITVPLPRGLRCLAVLTLPLIRHRLMKLMSGTNLLCHRPSPNIM